MKTNAVGTPATCQHPALSRLRPRFDGSVGERVVNRGHFLEKVALDPEGADDAEESFQAEGPDSTPPLAEPGRVSGGQAPGNHWTAEDGYPLRGTPVYKTLTTGCREPDGKSSQPAAVSLPGPVLLPQSAPLLPPRSCIFSAVSSCLLSL